MNTIHFVGEWFDCSAPKALLSDPQAIQAHCVKHLARRRLPVSYEYFTTSHGGGVIGAVSCAGMHLVLCTFPHRQTVTANLYVDDGESATLGSVVQIFDCLRDEFRPLRALFRRVQKDTRPSSSRGRTPRSPTEMFAQKPLPRAV